MNSNAFPSEDLPKGLTPELAAMAGDALEQWFMLHKRDLPWRSDRDGYSILVSEAMLQQTQVARVVEYFPRWMARFPSLSALAAASEEDVLDLWRGMGYYSRARNLLKAAQKLVGQGYEEIPPDPKILASLPGVGPYTLGAVCCIAFNLPVPAVDGNVKRVFARLLDLPGDPGQGQNKQLVEASVTAVLKSGTPSVLAQAMMELGATFCRPACQCGLCPLKDLCLAYRRGTQRFRPAMSSRKAVLRRNGAALLIESGKTFLVRRRPSTGLWAGFFEIPWIVGEAQEDCAACLERLQKQLRLQVALEDTAMEEALRYTSWHVRVRLWRIRGSAPSLEGWEAVSEEKLRKIHLPAGLHRLILRALDQDLP